ncbi:hypothetical protein CMI47_04265 [Candidatus Pacearchaeota archaeon]|jgi:hypothetical protein|nr:hypothetical protein [Candidatus Pacearchaeota archaeon]|tara:strand:+ start:5577 stop:6005 length:429 start_codon:yes stop_codon:yes gene_type:complete
MNTILAPIAARAYTEFFRSLKPDDDLPIKEFGDLCPSLQDAWIEAARHAICTWVNTLLKEHLKSDENMIEPLAILQIGYDNKAEPEEIMRRAIGAAIAIALIPIVPIPPAIIDGEPLIPGDDIVLDLDDTGPRPEPFDPMNN